MEDKQQHPNHEQLIIDHCTLLATQDMRIKSVEEAVIELRILNQKADKRMDEQDTDIAGIKKAFDILLPIVYGILSVSVLAFLGALLSYFMKV